MREGRCVPKRRHIAAADASGRLSGKQILIVLFM
jgi:hypothetical protein